MYLHAAKNSVHFENSAVALAIKIVAKVGNSIRRSHFFFVLPRWGRADQISQSQVETVGGCDTDKKKEEEEDVFIESLQA